MEFVFAKEMMIPPHDFWKLPFFEIIDLFGKYKEWADEQKKQSASESNDFQAKIERIKQSSRNYQQKIPQMPSSPQIPKTPDVPEVNLNAYDLPKFPER